LKLKKLEEEKKKSSNVDANPDQAVKMVDGEVLSDSSSEMQDGAEEGGGLHKFNNLIKSMIARLECTGSLAPI
jgi:hypothetical protein